MESEESIINLEHHHHSLWCLLSALENEGPWIHREKEWLDIGWGLKATCQEGELRTSIPELGAQPPLTLASMTLFRVDLLERPQYLGQRWEELPSPSEGTQVRRVVSWAHLGRYQTRSLLSITCAWILRGPAMDVTYVLPIFSKTFHGL